MLHTLQTIRKTKKRIGRGGARGKNAGHGHKGQRSRAGHKIRPAIRDELQRIPKRRGHNKNRSRGVRVRRTVRTVTLGLLEKHFSANQVVTPSILTERRIIAPVEGRAPTVKVVARGEITIPVTLKRCLTSKSAQEKIKAVGGTVQ